MPSFRLILILLAAIGIPTFLTFSTLLQSHQRHKFTAQNADERSKNNFRTFFSFRTPSTLFPPSAIISLTDDNSTFFLARPADFGPALASNGLSGRLWIGSGFSDSGHGARDTYTEGELGCSDVPGWDDAKQNYQKQEQMLEALQKQELLHEAKQGSIKRSLKGTPEAPTTESGIKTILEDSTPTEDDGTDDYLHHPLPTSSVARQPKPGHPAEHEHKTTGQAATHADIQSLQESAEIAGRVVLLSRGGCGFLEKVKWAQRRGAIALIVGDHTRGGALVTMYARGDTSNVSIPSVFTSHTTAHLLASLIPTDDFAVEQDGSQADALKGKASDTRLGSGIGDYDDRPTFTPAAAPRSTIRPNAKSRTSVVKGKAKSGSPDRLKPKNQWFKSFFGSGDSAGSDEIKEDRTRPPSSGRLDWLSPKWSEKTPKDEQAKGIPPKEKASAKPPSKDGSRSNSQHSASDDFVIGVQDWRDPDLVIPKSSIKTDSVLSASSQAPLATASLLSKHGNDDESGKGPNNLLSGGSITPGSGEYHKPDNSPQKKAKDKTNSDRDQTERIPAKGNTKDSEKPGFLKQEEDGAREEHEGLWVTITPTTMASSPFFDTLLVLVVSPLVTLTVVYALLLLRSRIRRRRWRAPKSVVERLPIRTYHTMSCSSTTSSTRYTTPRNSSPNSPHSQSSCLLTRSRPRSATASGIGEAVSASLQRATTKASGNEKARLLNKKKYSGRQVECVVCLEEYVDGRSKVMSLPCGHEFHAECITPWLTTRRRTCPICKGDVVRSLTNPQSGGPHASPAPQPDLVSSSDIQTQAAESTNDSPTAAIPIPCTNDLESGSDDMAATLVNDQPESSSSAPRGVWRGLANMSLSAFSGEAVWRQAREDRDR